MLVTRAWRDSYVDDRISRWLAVVKVRMQLARTLEVRGMWQTALSMAREEGPRAFVRVTGRTHHLNCVVLLTWARQSHSTPGLVHAMVAGLAAGSREGRVLREPAPRTVQAAQEHVPGGRRPEQDDIRDYGRMRGARAQGLS